MTGTSDHRGPAVVWRFLDGKRGHENQTAGLVHALAKRRPLLCHDIAVPSRMVRTRQWFSGRQMQTFELPDPDLVIGAGNATQFPLLTARRIRGGRAVVLMKPTLPLRWFDLCVVPEHDEPEANNNVLTTRGVLNTMYNHCEKDPDRGLVLIGGPSRHHDWNDAALFAALNEIASGEPSMTWTIVSSRRTLPATAAALGTLPSTNTTLMHFEKTDPTWLPRTLATAKQVWVTEDSVSMVYEALTAGAATGILPVPRRGDSRVSRAVDTLLGEGAVVSFASWNEGVQPSAPRVQLNEAARCAEWIDEHWLNHG